MRNLLFILGFVFLLLNGCKKEKTYIVAASPKADSLAYFFERANDDSLAVDQRRMFTEKAIALIANDPNDSMNRVNYFKVANRYWNMDEKEDFKKMTQFIIKSAKEAEDMRGLAKAYSYMGDYFQLKKMLDSVYAYIYEEQKVYKELNDEDNMAKALLKKAYLQHRQSDFLGCERTIFNVKKLGNVEDFTVDYEVNNLLGICYTELGELSLSLKYYKVALEKANQKDIPIKYQLYATTLNNIGILYQFQKDYKNAKEKFNEALRKQNLFYDRPNIYAMAKCNLAYSKFKLGDFNDLPEMFFEALSIRDSLFIPEGILINKVYLSEYYAFQKDTATAIRFAKEARDCARGNNIKRDELVTLKQLAAVDKKNAKQYAEAYFALSDSLQLSEKKIRNKFARIEYDTETLEQETEKLTQQREAIIYIALWFVLIGIAVFVIRFQMDRIKQQKQVSKQHQADDEIYRLMMDQHHQLEEGKKLEKKRIARELHDGVMGRLTGIRLNLFVLSKKTDPETIARCLGRVDEIHAIEKEIRAIAYDLENNLFSGTINFVTMVGNLFETAMTHSQIQFYLDVDETIDWAVMEGKIKIHIYRILQEALQNINKYAFAKTIRISMKTQDHSIFISVADDGVGFDSRKVKKGLGLKNITERAKEINGKIAIITAEGQGTAIHLTIKIQ